MNTAFKIRNVLEFLFKKSSLKINILSNFLGNIWNALLSILFVPVYIYYLGIESYGIIGIFSSIQAFLWTFDLGLSPALNREIAQLSSSSDNDIKIKNTVRTLEVASWMISILITCFLLILSPILTFYWVDPNQLSEITVTESFLLMSLSFGFQLPLNLYSSGLMGLRRQMLLNSVNIGCACFRYLGAFYVITQISSTIQAFLLWQVIATVLQTFLVAICLWKAIPRTKIKAKFQTQILKKISGFALGIASASGFILFILQIDKIILSKMASLEMVGYYSLATMIAMTSLGSINSSISNALYPSLAQATQTDDEKHLKFLYHKSAQIMSVSVIPLTIFLAVFSSEILHLWLRNKTIVNNTGLILTFIAVSIGISCLKTIPYNLQLAVGWTKLDFYNSLIGALIIIPLIISGIYLGGAVGASVGLVIFRVINTFAPTIIMHRKVLPGEFARWLFKDIGLPLLTGGIIIGIGKFFMISFYMSDLMQLAVMSAVLAAAFLGAGCSTMFFRQWIMLRIKFLNSLQKSSS